MSAPAISARRRRVLTVLLMMGTFLSSLDITVVGTAMPSIAASLGGISLYGWVFSAYLLTSTVTVPLYGKLADRWGRRPTYLLGMGLFLIGSAACGAATSMPYLVAARAAQGVGAGALAPLTVIAMGDMYEVRERVRVMSVFGLVWGVSSVIGPTVGGALVGLGWPWVFYVNLPIGGLVFAGVATAWSSDRRAARAPIDVAGAILVSGATCALLFAMKALEEGALERAIALFVAALVLTLGFARAEARAPDPIMPASLFHDRAIVVGAAMGVFLGGALFVAIAFVPLYLRAVAGFGPVAAGAALIPMSLLWTAGSYTSGRAITRFGYRAPIRLGALLVALGASGSLVAVLVESAGVLIASSGLIGAGMGLGLTPANVVAQERVPFEKRGTATALLVFARTMGGTVFVSALGLVMARILASNLGSIEGAPRPEALLEDARRAELPPGVAESVEHALANALEWVFAGGAAAGLLAALLGRAFPPVPFNSDKLAEVPSGSAEV